MESVAVFSKSHKDEALSATSMSLQEPSLLGVVRARSVLSSSANPAAQQASPELRVGSG